MTPEKNREAEFCCPIFNLATEFDQSHVVLGKLVHAQLQASQPLLGRRKRDGSRISLVMKVEVDCSGERRTLNIRNCKFQ